MKTKAIAVGLVATFALWVKADQIVMQNGDHYNGTVVSVTTNALVLQSEVLGTLNLSRSKVSQIVFGNVGSSPTIAQANATPPNKTNVAPLAATVRQLKSQPQLIQQVQTQYLNDATPEAKAKFDQMLTELATGKMSVGDLRAEAKATADQLRALQKDLGEDAGDGLDGYLAILDNFVQASVNAVPATNSGTLPKPALPKQK